MDPNIVLLVAAIIIGLSFLSFGLILGLCVRSAVKEFSQQQRWIWRRFIAMIEPTLQVRVSDMVEAEIQAQETEDNLDMSKPLEPTVEPVAYRFS